jgi:exonuclease III
VCSWNPNADGLLDQQNLQKCLYGTLGVMAPDILCLQETIWEPENFLEMLKEGQPDDKHFIFSGKMATFQHSSQEAAILYNPDKLKVDIQIASEVNDAWRVRVQSVRETSGAVNDWRRDKKLEDRTIALQGVVVSANTKIIIISINMFNNSYSDVQRETLATEIVDQAQELANECNMTVVLGGDWNCKIKNIELSAEAVMPNPTNPFNGNTEDDGNDSVILINPTARAEAGDGPAAVGDAAAGPAEAGAVGAAADGAAADGAAGPAGAAAAEPLKLKLDKVQFFRWTGNVTTADMGGLTPEAIDRIYRRGGKHRPIVANVKIEQIVADNLANNAN